MNQVARKANTTHEVPSAFGPAIAELRGCAEVLVSATEAIAAHLNGAAAGTGRGSRRRGRRRGRGVCGRVIVKITRGGRTQGLMSYLVGPGHANEHTSPHLVAASAGVMTWYGHDELSGVDALSIGNLMDLPRRVSGTEVTLGVKAFDEASGTRVATGERLPAHVWHCSLSLPPTAADGIANEPLEDERWGAIARDFVAELGFTESSGKAGCRWAGVHHGQSINGDDHIHVAVQLVREDGTKASTHND